VSTLIKKGQQLKILLFLQGSHYILVLKFKAFKDPPPPEGAYSRTNFWRKFTAWTVLQQYFNICFCDYVTVLVEKNKNMTIIANLVFGKILV